MGANNVQGVLEGTTISLPDSVAILSVAVGSYEQANDKREQYVGYDLDEPIRGQKLVDREGCQLRDVVVDSHQ